MSLRIFHPGNYGTYQKDGIEWIRLYPRWQIPAYKTTVILQGVLWKAGFPWHNVFANECTPDFDCCLTKTPR